MAVLRLVSKEMSVNKESLKAAHDVIREKFGPIDILINAAGGNHPKGQQQKNIYLQKI